MKTHALLGQLSILHQLMQHLIESVPEADAYHAYLPDTPPLAWLLGRAVYLETYWLHEVVLQDPTMTARVRPLLGPKAQINDELITQLPPRDHLLNWALELQDQNLTLLANPSQLPDHPLREKQSLLPLLLQQQAQLCELMLAQLTERRLQEESSYTVSTPLLAAAPAEDHIDVQQGHYRVGAKDDPAALDNELPPQIVHLHGFRIDAHPVTNAAWLSFIEADAYDKQELWSEAGWQWRQQHNPHPHHWRCNEQGHWYGLGLNGPFALLAEDAVYGISAHEAQAYAQWVASLGGRLAGAVVQHEYQWEVAARTQAITDYGRVWEWCANPFHAYTGYQAPTDIEAASDGFDSHLSLRGGCLHSQRIQRRHSYRHHASAAQRHLFCGTRLVFPPSKMPWHK
ncbi:MAG: SUMF1/EgtB/PvdO family nonheme iron enzyme [Thiohalomonadaceae bacterium]